jgi:hypothetical protein
MQTLGRDATAPIEEKVTAELEGSFVVFQIGLRVNSFWKIHRWLPLFLVAPRMLRELARDDDGGLLGSRTVLGPGIRNVGFVQYWESFESLREYARDGDRGHFPAWQEYYRDGTREDAAVGIWHETYVVRSGEYENLYNNMPPFGLGASDRSELVSADGEREWAAGRLGRGSS